LTTLGIIKCEITKARENFVVCKNVEFQNMKFNGLFYLERDKIGAYQINKEETIIKDKTPVITKILQFPGRVDKVSEH